MKELRASGEKQNGEADCGTELVPTALVGSRPKDWGGPGFWVLGTSWVARWAGKLTRPSA